MIVPILFLAAGAAALIALAFSKEERPVPDRPPDLPAAPPGKTKWKGVNNILGELQKASEASKIPLGLLVGWVAKESGGLLEEWGAPRAKPTKYDERGFFQLMPDESKSIGVDHKRLSSDPNYSINAGLKLIARYQGVIDKLHAVPEGSEFYWLLVKGVHTVGSSGITKWVNAAKAANAVSSWPVFAAWSLAHEDQLMHEMKHSPKKWVPFLQAVFDVGRPFGFSNQSVSIGGDFDDIVDPLDVVDRK